MEDLSNHQFGRASEVQARFILAVHGHGAYWERLGRSALDKYLEAKPEIEILEALGIDPLEWSNQDLYPSVKPLMALIFDWSQTLNIRQSDSLLPPVWWVETALKSLDLWSRNPNMVQGKHEPSLPSSRAVWSPPNPPTFVSTGSPLEDAEALSLELEKHKENLVQEGWIKQPIPEDWIFEALAKRVLLKSGPDVLKQNLNRPESPESISTLLGRLANELSLELPPLTRGRKPNSLKARRKQYLSQGTKTKR